MNIRLAILSTLCAAVAAGAPPALADSPAASQTNAVHYYLSLGDSLAESFQPNGDLTDGYAEQLYAALAADDAKLELVKLGCSGETTHSMIFRNPCGYPHGSQLAEAGSFLHAHQQFVSQVTLDIGGNDIEPCLASADPQCFHQGLAQIQTNLPQILADLRAAAPGVPIIGMTYYDVVAPICVSDPSLAFLCSEIDTLNAALTDAYVAAGDPVADVAGAFENDDLAAAAAHVCTWTWFCTLGDEHPNSTGYGVIAEAFEQVVQ